MNEREESLQRELQQARKEVDDAHRIIALLVKKAGGKVTLDFAELTNDPPNQVLESCEDPATKAFHIRVFD